MTSVLLPGPVTAADAAAAPRVAVSAPGAPLAYASPADARDEARAGRARQALGRFEVGPTSRVAGARRVFGLRYSTTSVRGEVVPATGLVLVPRGRPPAQGWPTVVYGHMTTGAADRCAPTRGRRGHPELRRMQQGDDYTRRLLRAGVMVLRPDFEGLGAPGPHPYLRGASLGVATVDMLAAARQVVPVGPRWVSAGHSEGAVAALNSASRDVAGVRGQRLAGVVALTPVTQIEVLFDLLEESPVAVEPLGVLAGLAALILKGAAAEDPAFRRLLLRRGGLSPEARRLWPHIERRCLQGLSAGDSWGGLAPGAIGGPRGREASARLQRGLERSDVRLLQLRDVPVRIDAGIVDEVAPLPLTEELVASYEEQGLDITVGRWPALHSSTNSDAHAAPAAARWTLRRLGIG